MSITKKRSMTLDDYLTGLVSSPFKITEGERLECAAFLLERDYESNESSKLKEAIMGIEYDLAMDISKFLMAETPEALNELINTMKKNILHFYEDEMTFLMDKKQYEIEQEKKLKTENEFYLFPTHHDETDDEYKLNYNINL